MRVAITGGIAEGKSTVLAALCEMGFETLSSDTVARDLFLRPEVQQQLACLSGLPLPVDPAKLRETLVLNRTVRADVNRLMHPMVMNELDQSEATFFEVPLLVESCLQDRFDQVWVVTCGADEQDRRLRARYGENADLVALKAWQLPTSAKVPFADLVLRTNRPFERVNRELAEAVSGLFGK